MSSFTQTSSPAGCICCRRFHTDVFFSSAEELRLSWSSIFSRTLTSLTSCSIAAKTGGRGRRSEGQQLGLSAERSKVCLRSLDKPQGRNDGSSLHVEPLPHFFLCFFFHNFVSITTHHLITHPPRRPSPFSSQPD